MNGAPQLARSRAYALLGDLFLNGVTPATRPAWLQVEAAAALLPPEAEAAELHARVVLLDVAAHESAFRSPTGLLGGDVLGEVHALRARCGLPPLDDGDHVGQQLGWLGFLAGAQADGVRDGVATPQILPLEREVLDHHVLRWLPGFVGALRARPEAAPLYRLAGELALALAVQHRVELGADSDGWALPDAEPILDNPRAGLRAIAEQLALPAQAGGHFARSTLVGLGRSLNIPSGFGSRADLLEGLLRSAAHYDRVAELAAALGAVLTTWDAAWAELDAAGLGVLCAPWRARIGVTRAMLGRLREAGQLRG